MLKWYAFTNQYAVFYSAKSILKQANNKNSMYIDLSSYKT